MRRRGITNTVHFYGKAGAVEMKGVKSDMMSVCHKLSKYPPSTIYNEGQSSLFHQFLSNITCLASEESKRSAWDIKGIQGKNFKTFTVCTNADGSYIVPTLFICESKNPHKLGPPENKDKLSEVYRAQNNSCMSIERFLDYVNNI